MNGAIATIDDGAWTAIKHTKRDFRAIVKRSVRASAACDPRIGQDGCTSPVS
jgi:hypothetical protein